MRVGGFAGQLGDKLNKQIDKSGAADMAAVAAGPLGAGINIVRKGLPGMKIDTGKLAEKIGLGRYKPGEIGMDESPFRDTSRSEGLVAELEKQRGAIKNRKFDEAQAAQLGGAAQLDLENQAQMRAGQQDLIAALQQQAAGEGPSLAAMQMDDARQQNIATAMALGASQRGLSAGQGLRSIAEQTQDANQVAAREAMRGRIAEQLAARQQLEGVLSGARAQDIGIASTQAGLDQQAAIQQGLFDQQAAIANMQGQLTAQGQQDAFLQALNQQIGGLTMGEQANLQELERMKLAREMGLEGIRAGGYAGQQQAISGLIGALSQGAAKVASA